MLAELPSWARCSIACRITSAIATTPSSYSCCMASDDQVNGSTTSRRSKACMGADGRRRQKQAIAGGGRRTRRFTPTFHVGYGRILMLHITLKEWCCWGGLNSRPHPYQGCALPLSYSSRPFERAGGARPPAGARFGCEAWLVKRAASAASPLPWAIETKTTRPARNASPPSCARTCGAARRRRASWRDRRGNARPFPKRRERRLGRGAPRRRRSAYSCLA